MNPPDAASRSEADIVDEAAKNGEYRAPGTPEHNWPLISYEADERGRVYEKNTADGSVWPTGVVWTPWKGRNNITQEEFDRMLRTERR